MRLGDALAALLELPDRGDDPIARQLQAAAASSVLAERKLDEIAAAEFAALAKRTDDPHRALDALEHVAALAEHESTKSGAASCAADERSRYRSGPTSVSSAVRPIHFWLALASLVMVAVLALLWAHRPLPQQLGPDELSVSPADHCAQRPGHAQMNQEVPLRAVSFICWTAVESATRR